MVDLIVDRIYLKDSDADVLALGVFQDSLDNLEIQELDLWLGGAISSVIKKKIFTADFKQLFLVSSSGRNVLLVGLGKRDVFDAEKLRKVSAGVAKYARDTNFKSVATNLHVYLSEGDGAYLVSEGVLLSLYSFDKKTSSDKKYLEKFVFCEVDDYDSVVSRVDSAGIVCGSVNYVRDLVNASPSLMTPKAVAYEAIKLNDRNVRVRVFNKEELEMLGMNLLLAVGRGSSEDPKLVVLEYGDVNASPIVLVGKGITFDSGGLGIKSASGMEEMKMDMAGAASVLGVFKALKELKLNVNVVGVLALAENMTGDNAFKPGDIISAFNKKTVEVLHTDAEGRLVLADALSYSVSVYNPKYVVDMATLTGAAIVALGNNVSAVVGNDQSLVDSLVDSGNKTFERLWQLPLFEDYADLMKSDFADLKNISTTQSGAPAGCITAGYFLSQFVGNSKWAHLDIAGPAWSSEEKDYIKKGATGIPVRLLLEFLSRAI